MDDAQAKEVLARTLAEMFSQDTRICRDWVSDNWDNLCSYMTLDPQSL